MLNITHKRPRRQNAARSNKPASVRRLRKSARLTPKIMGERFAAAMLSGDKKKMDRILHEIAEIFPPSDSPGEFLELMSELLARTAHQALKQHVIQEELRNQALTDELTGLHNRRGFFALAEQHLKFARRNREHALLFFADINGLKQINDRFGHSEGDAAIERMARVLERTFRDSDVAARLGGDEFAILANEANPNSREDILGRLKENLQSEGLRDPRYPLSLSVGVARFDPQNPMTVDGILNLADRAMYEAKRSPRDGLCSAAMAKDATGKRMAAPAA
jgi:diguanylate cyclase (GGDEF)-like protein